MEQLHQKVDGSDVLDIGLENASLTGDKSESLLTSLSSLNYGRMPGCH